MVKKTSGRKLTSKHWKYIKIADNTDIGHISRSQLIFLVQELPIIGLIKGTEVLLLTKLLSTVPITHFEKGKIPIVFKTNHQIGLEIGCTSVHVSRLLSRLFDKGLIVMRDSANYKRYGFNSANYVPIACGIDLSILIARYHELQHSILTIKEEKKHHIMAVRTFRGICRRLRFRIEEIKFTPIAPIFLNRMNKIKAVLGSPFKASTVKLEKAIKLFNWLLDRLFFTKMLCRNNQNVMQLHNTIPNLICKSNKNEYSNFHENNQDRDTTENYTKTAYEKKRESKTRAPLSASNSTLPQIRPEMLARALPNTAIFLKHGLQSERDLIGSMELLAKMKGISSHALEEAKTTMGIQKAALAIAIIFEKHCKELINSAGGYLRGMIAKENRGQLYLERSFYALLDQAFEEKCNNKCMQKNDITKQKGQKSSLFKSEFNEVLKSFKMSKYQNKFSSESW